jgi:enoyl-CoA hydratase
MNEPEVVRLDETTDALILRLDRPPVNAVTLDVVRSLASVVARIAACPPGRPLVITGTGSCFSAGLDLKVVPRYRREEQREMIGAINRVIRDLYGMPRPTVAAVNGHALAAGLVLALTCDYRVSTSAPCRFGLPEINVGVPYPAAPMVVVREELPPPTARVLVLSGQTFDPATALARGVVDEVVEPERVLPRATEMAVTMAAFPAYGRIKAQLRASALAAIVRIVTENDDPLLAEWI